MGYTRLGSQYNGSESPCSPGKVYTYGAVAEKLTIDQMLYELVLAKSAIRYVTIRSYIGIAI